MSRHATSLLVLVLVAGGSVLFSQQVKSGVAALQNPVAATPASIAAGKRAYDLNCAGCHGNKAQGSEKAGVVISIIQEQGGKQPPDLTDAAWDHGSSDSEIFGVIKRGVPPTMMAGFDGRIPDAEIWSLVNYLRALAKGDVTVAPATETARQPGRRWNSPSTCGCRSPAEPTRRQHPRPARAGQLHARGAWRPALLRQRPQRPALHPRQAQQAVHDVPGLQRPRRAARPVPASSRSSATSRWA